MEGKKNTTKTLQDLKDKIQTSEDWTDLMLLTQKFPRTQTLRRTLITETSHYSRSWEDRLDMMYGLNLAHSYEMKVAKKWSKDLLLDVTDEINNTDYTENDRYVILSNFVSHKLKDKIWACQIYLMQR